MLKATLFSLLSFTAIFFLSNRVSPVEINDTGRFAPISTFDQQTVNVVNENFKRVTKIQPVDLDSDIRVPSSTLVFNVTFSVPQSDTNYVVSVTSSRNATLSVLNKTTTGYELVFSSAGTGETKIDWVIFR